MPRRTFAGCCIQRPGRMQQKEKIMSPDHGKQSTAESLRKTRTHGKFRCHNPTCMERIQPEAGSKTAKCPTCGMEYRIHWVTPTLPRIRGPVWEVNRKLAEAKLKEAEAKLKEKGAS